MARHKETGRTTSKGTTATAPGAGREASSLDGPSPAWVPIVMFSLLVVGVLLILLNYTVEILGMPSNWYLIGGLALVLGGIIAATQYR